MAEKNIHYMRIGVARELGLSLFFYIEKGHFCPIFSTKKNDGGQLRLFKKYKDSQN